MLQVCQAFGIPAHGTVDEMRLVCATLLDLTQPLGVRFQMYVKHGIRGVVADVFVNLRLKEVPAMWYRDADVPLPPVLLQGPMPEVKVGLVVVCGWHGLAGWLAGWLID